MSIIVDALKTLGTRPSAIIILTVVFQVSYYVIYYHYLNQYQCHMLVKGRKFDKLGPDWMLSYQYKIILSPQYNFLYW